MFDGTGRGHRKIEDVVGSVRQVELRAKLRRIETSDEKRIAREEDIGARGRGNLRHRLARKRMTSEMGDRAIRDEEAQCEDGERGEEIETRERLEWSAAHQKSI